MSRAIDLVSFVSRRAVAALTTTPLIGRGLGTDPSRCAVTACFERLILGEFVGRFALARARHARNEVSANGSETLSVRRRCDRCQAIRLITALSRYRRYRIDGPRNRHDTERGHDRVASVLSLTQDSQIGANLRICADEEDRADFDQPNREVANGFPASPPNRRLKLAEHTLLQAREEMGTTLR